jgi:ABC-type branched-subunit amino acid transport system substrate-binding protein
MTSPNETRKTLKRFIVALAIPIAVSQAASAAEWRYCLSPSEDEHKVYFSGTFTTSADSWSTENSFDQALIQAGLGHHEVQCPRAADENSIMTMLQDAVTYNQRVGRKIIYEHWEPVH